MTDLPLYKVRDLVYMEDLLSLPSRLKILFEDGEVLDTTNKKTYYSNFFWELIRQYPNTPIRRDYHMHAVLGNKVLTSEDDSILLTKIYTGIVGAYNLDLPEKKEHLLALCYDVVNEVSNVVPKVAEHCVSSVDILDFVEIVYYPPFKEVVDAIEPDKDSIKNGYTKALYILMNDPALANNNIVKALKSKMVNANQLLQCLVYRGFVTEVSGSIFPTPITSNFTKGLNNAYEFLAESRSAAKALMFSKAPLEDAEYFARRLQLLTMPIERIVYKDCGSTTYIDWRVTPPAVNDYGVVVYPGDLAFMLGKHYLDEETRELRTITHNDPALFNKVLKLRTAMYCKVKNPHHICNVCFGKLSDNISRFANLGYYSSSTMTEQTSQSVLSTKHLDASSVSVSVVLNETASNFFVLNRAKDSYILKKDFKKQGLKLIINREEAIGLVDILTIDDIENVNPMRISNVEFVELVYTVNKQEVSVPIFINQGSRRAILTSDFLRHLKTHRWEIDSRNNFVFDMEKWNYSLPVFKLPNMEYSFSEHSSAVAKLIESSMKNISERSKPHSPISTLQELFSLVNNKLVVNISLLEVIVYANMIKSSEDYSLGRNSDTTVLGVANNIIQNRSLSAAYAYKQQVNTLTNPSSFFPDNRPDSPLDAMFLPYEVLMNKSKE